MNIWSVICTLWDFQFHSVGCYIYQYIAIHIEKKNDHGAVDVAAILFRRIIICSTTTPWTRSWGKFFRLSTEESILLKLLSSIDHIETIGTNSNPPDRNADELFNF